MRTIGWSFLARLAAPRRVVAPQTVARQEPVTRVIYDADGSVRVPPSVAPASDDPLEHLMFALRYEGVNAEIAAALFDAQVVTPVELVRAFDAAPSGQFVRRACYLYEALTDRTIEGRSVSAGNYVDLHDANRFVTRAGNCPRNQKWRVIDNGLGAAGGWFSPMVRRTSALVQAQSTDLAAALAEFAERARAQGLLERTLGWAYLAETEKSFEIEKETASPDKQRRFVELLQQAHERRPLAEDYLVELQNAAISNPLDLAAGFRTEQNWLARGPGAVGVRYVPPPPEMVRPLMDALMAFANAPAGIDPLVHAALVSFGFVFVHPFMDGNGRLSRFLFHHALCCAGLLEHGLLLPVSVAMKRNEQGYLAALESFSKPARTTWDVTHIDAERFAMSFRGTSHLYRHFDGTRVVEFGVSCAWAALDEYLKDEVLFLERYDRLRASVDAQFDIRDNVLHHLVVGALQNAGRVSKRLRKRYAEQVPADVFDAIEQRALAVGLADSEPAEPAAPD